MKIRHLLPLLAFVCMTVTYTSCKKDTKQPENPVLSSKDPQAISAAVKVWHGQRLQGTAPAPKGTAVELDASVTPPVTLAFKGRYAIINPAVAQGEIAGYYLQFNGAKEYFKIDYSKPRGGRVANRKPESPFKMDSRHARTMNGNADSSIVIALPDNLQVPDTFCVSFCAYDVTGNVSNVVTTCIVVNSLGTDAAGSFLHGEWKNTATWDSGGQAHDTVIYNRWVGDSYYSGYVCATDAAGNSYLNYNFNGTTPLVNDSTFYLKSHIVFATNGGINFDYSAKRKSVDLTQSSCSSFIFFPIEEENEKMTGAWNYNAATGKMVLIFEFDDAGLPSLEAWEYKVTKVSNNNIILTDDTFGYPYHIRFEK